MKRLSLPVLVAAMTVTALLAACSGGTNAATSSGSGDGTLTLASVDQGSIEDVVKAFEAANPGVKEYEQAYYAQPAGTPPGDAANKKTA